MFLLTRLFFTTLLLLTTSLFCPEWPDKESFPNLYKKLNEVGSKWDFSGSLELLDEISNVNFFEKGAKVNLDIGIIFAYFLNLIEVKDEKKEEALKKLKEKKDEILKLQLAQKEDLHLFLAKKFVVGFCVLEGIEYLEKGLSISKELKKFLFTEKIATHEDIKEMFDAFIKLGRSYFLIPAKSPKFIPFILATRYNYFLSREESMFSREKSVSCAKMDIQNLICMQHFHFEVFSLFPMFRMFADNSQSPSINVFLHKNFLSQVINQIYSPIIKFIREKLSNNARLDTQNIFLDLYSHFYEGTLETLINIGNPTDCQLQTAIEIISTNNWFQIKDEEIVNIRNFSIFILKVLLQKDTADEQSKKKKDKKGTTIRINTALYYKIRENPESVDKLKLIFFLADNAAKSNSKIAADLDFLLKDKILYTGTSNQENISAEHNLKEVFTKKEKTPEEVAKIIEKKIRKLDAKRLKEQQEIEKKLKTEQELKFVESQENERKKAISEAEASYKKIISEYNKDTSALEKQAQLSLDNINRKELEKASARRQEKKNNLFTTPGKQRFLLQISGNDNDKDRANMSSTKSLIFSIFYGCKNCKNFALTHYQNLNNFIECRSNCYPELQQLQQGYNVESILDYIYRETDYENPGLPFLNRELDYSNLFLNSFFFELDFLETALQDTPNQNKFILNDEMLTRFILDIYKSKDIRLVLKEKNSNLFFFLKIYKDEDEFQTVEFFIPSKNSNSAQILDTQFFPTAATIHGLVDLVWSKNKKPLIKKLIYHSMLSLCPGIEDYPLRSWLKNLEIKNIVNEPNNRLVNLYHSWFVENINNLERSYKIEQKFNIYDPDAELDKLENDELKKQVMQRLIFFGDGAKQLTGLLQGIYSMKAGSFRILYTTVSNQLTIQQVITREHGYEQVIRSQKGKNVSPKKNTMA